MALKAKFTSGGGNPMSFSCYEYHIYDENYEYFSMVKYDLDKCVHGETILEIRWSMGGQGVWIVDSIPDEVEGHEKWSEQGVLESGNGQAKLKKQTA